MSAMGFIKGVAVSDNVYYLDNEGALNKLHDSNEEKLFENMVAFGIYGTNIYFLMICLYMLQIKMVSLLGK